jgi:hypothetical protein
VTAEAAGFSSAMAAKNEAERQIDNWLKSIN